MEKELRVARGAELLEDEKIVVEFLRGVSPFNVATRLNVTRIHVMNVLKKDERTSGDLPSYEEVERVYKEMNGITDAPAPVEKEVQPKKAKVSAAKKRKPAKPAKPAKQAKKAKVEKLSKKEQIKALEKDGKTVKEICALVQVPPSTVYNVRGMARKNGEVLPQTNKGNEKQEQVARLDAEGKTTKEICALLQICKSSVYNYRSAIKKEANANNRTVTKVETITQQILRLDAEGKQVKEICDLLQVTPMSVYSARSYGRKKGKKIGEINKSETKYQQILRMDAEGKTVKEMCALIGTTKNFIYNVRSKVKCEQEKAESAVVSSPQVIELPKQQKTAEPTIAKAKVPVVSIKEPEALKEAILKTAVLPEEATQLSVHDEEILTHIFALYDNKLITRQEVVSLISRS